MAIIWETTSFLKLKKAYLNQMLVSEFGELDDLEKEVINSISENKIVLSRLPDKN